LYPHLQGSSGILQVWFKAQSNEVVMGRCQKIDIFASGGTGRSCATAGRLSTKQCTGKAIGARTDAGEQCADAIEAGVGADGPVSGTHINLGTGMGSGIVGRAKCGDGAAYVVLDT